MSDLALSTLFSLTAADALGAATEFKTLQTIRAHFGPRITEYQPGSVFGFAPGEATDDSQMTVATLLGYAAGSGTPGVLTALQDWLNAGPPDVGGLTGSALHRNTLDGGVQAWERSGFNSAGNGGLMRVAAVWIAGFRGEALAYQSAVITALTHADPRCVQTSVFFTAFMQGLSEGQPYDIAAETALKVMDGYDARMALQDATLLGIDTLNANRIFRERDREARAQVRSRVRAGLKGHLTSQSGFVLDTLEAAVKHAQADSWQEAIEPAVMLGDDSDTVACVVGALVGARGLEIPSHLLPPLRLGHTWQGWQRPWPCVEHFPRLVQEATHGAGPGSEQA